MPVETDKPDFDPGDLNPAWPLEDDDVGSGDDHMRLIKKALRYAWDNGLFPSPGGGGGGGGHVTGDIRYVSVDPLGADAPNANDYLIASGQEADRTTYADLFAKIGTRFGQGDGSTTFGLPDANLGFVPKPTGEYSRGISTGLGFSFNDGKVNAVGGGMCLLYSSPKDWYLWLPGDVGWNVIPKPPIPETDPGSSHSAIRAAMLPDNNMLLAYTTSSSSSNPYYTCVYNTERKEYEEPREIQGSYQNWSEIEITSDGVVWLIVGNISNDLWYLDPVTWEAKRATSKPGGSVLTIGGGMAGNIAVAAQTNGYLYTYTPGDPGNGNWFAFPSTPSSRNIEQIVATKDGATYFWGGNKMHFYDKAQGAWVELPDPPIGGAGRGIGYNDLDGVVTYMMPRTGDSIFHVTVGDARARILGYVKT